MSHIATLQHDVLQYAALWLQCVALCCVCAAMWLSVCCNMLHYGCNMLHCAVHVLRYAALWLRLPSPESVGPIHLQHLRHKKSHGCLCLAWLCVGYSPVSLPLYLLLAWLCSLNACLSTSVLMNAWLCIYDMPVWLCLTRSPSLLCLSAVVSVADCLFICQFYLPLHRNTSTAHELHRNTSTAHVLHRDTSTAHELVITWRWRWR